MVSKFSDELLGFSDESLGFSDGEALELVPEEGELAPLEEEGAPIFFKIAEISSCIASSGEEEVELAPELSAPPGAAG